MNHDARRRWPRFTLAAVVLLLAVGAVPEAQAQDGAGGPWTAWLGCWDLIQERDGTAETPIQASRRVCLEAGDSDLAVDLTTQVDGEVALLQQIVADGRERELVEGGCSGVESARFSADGARLLVRSSLHCGDRPVVSSGITMLSSSQIWTDVQVSEVEGQREVLVRRYRRVEPAAPALDDQALLARVSRQAAGAPLDADDVIEALEWVDPAAVEAMLLEGDHGFEMNADLLLRLADADVPDNVVDLMVALSYPDYFRVDDADGQELERSEDRGYRTYGRGYWSYPWFAYGYYDPYFAPFGRGSYYYPGPGGFVVIGGGTRFGGKVVRGKGFTRVQPTGNAPSGGLGRLFHGGGDRGTAVSSGSRGGGGGAVTRSGTSRAAGSSSATRTAKPRGGSSSERSAKPRGGGRDQRQ